MKVNIDLNKLIGEYDFRPDWLDNLASDEPFTVRLKPLTGGQKRRIDLAAVKFAKEDGNFIIPTDLMEEILRTNLIKVNNLFAGGQEVTKEDIIKHPQFSTLALTIISELIERSNLDQEAVKK